MSSTHQSQTSTSGRQSVYTPSCICGDYVPPPAVDETAAPALYCCSAGSLIVLDFINLCMRSVEDSEARHFFVGFWIVLAILSVALLVFHQPEPSAHAPICPYYRDKGWKSDEPGIRAFLCIVLALSAALLFWTTYSQPLEQSACVLSSATLEDLNKAVAASKGSQ
ncbi:hypothetical protein I302_107633 [Kwoniella bestiolae CBS 10118]|uniref:Transmembrane protein n=1 Tax=Kwoniella bestiolae CBS 10118 TaxID=1296100 RepID=A0A1B9FY06_9TREE|nr:hypothetical protein I302_06628 [Kwoniella bestiolae CBS 10118]OCF23645.1 hypothetical protein I302_06628 [Kwoniella bestiolae CBS 10118]